MAQQSDIKYLTPIAVDIRKKKYCRFKKSGIKYIDYKDAEFLKKFVNEQGRILPRRLTGTSLKYQKKVAQAVKRATSLAAMLDVDDTTSYGPETITIYDLNTSYVYCVYDYSSGDNPDRSMLDKSNAVIKVYTYGSSVPRALFFMMRSCEWRSLRTEM